MSNREELIASLSAELKPVKPMRPIDVQALLWFALSAAYVMVISHGFGPIRPEALQQLITVPRFLLENTIGLAALVMITLTAFRAAVPGRLSPRFALISFALLALWLCQYLLGLAHPTLEPSMAGKRESCWLQTLCFAVPPMVLAVVMTRRLYPLNPFKSALPFCLAAGLLPALYMQMVCMYVVPHILNHHILPGLAIALVGSAVARWVIGRR